MVSIPVTVSSDIIAVPVVVSSLEETVPCAASAVVEVLPDPYTGSYDITPTDEEQTLVTVGKSMASNVIVHAIPSNYGRIAWNGSYLTVS